MKQIFLLCAILFQSHLFAQINEDFSDGDFSTNPTWFGNTDHFIINSDFQLQTDMSVAGTSYLTTPHDLNSFENIEWNFYTKMTFAGSGSNFAKIYLSALEENLAANPDGYFILLGEPGALDAVKLFRRENGSNTLLLKGTDGAIATLVNAHIKIRYKEDTWHLAVDYNGGTNYTNEDSLFLPSNIDGQHFGFLCTYTISNAKRFYFDNIYVGPEWFDTVPPTLIGASMQTERSVELTFSENITPLSAQDLANYHLSPAQVIDSAIHHAEEQHIVTLYLHEALQNGTEYTVFSTGISDQAGNVQSMLDSISFGVLYAETPAYKDIVINEFFCRVNPSVGLPDRQFVELYNRSSRYFNLAGWKIADEVGSGTLGSAWLAPGEYKVLCANANTDLYENSVGVSSFPLLNQAGDDIVLIDIDGVVIDSISYTDAWYQDANKKNGGYTIELINPFHPCSTKDNWTASNSPLGGTPAAINSVYDTVPATPVIEVVQTEILAPNALRVYLNTVLAPSTEDHLLIHTQPHLSVLYASVHSTETSYIDIHFAADFAGSVPYILYLQQVADCWLNTTTIEAHFLFPEMAELGDILLNEILFNPYTGGSDFVELYNASSKIIDLQHWSMANHNGGPANLRTIPDSYLLYPDDYVVLSADPDFLLQHYPAYVPNKAITLNLPNYNNDSSTVYLIRDSTIMDKVSYAQNWHFSLLADYKGKSLERIRPELPSNASSSWHSASEAIGYASPGRINSQDIHGLFAGTISLSSETISPDNDGFEDLLLITYELVEPGMVASLTIYDDRGRIVRRLVSNELLGTAGSFTWDGLTDTESKATVGPHVIIFEGFHEDGQTFRIKKVVTVAAMMSTSN